MLQEMEYIPLEIIRHILSYNEYPSHSAVCSGFKEAEMQLNMMRAERIRAKYKDDVYEALDQSEWMDVIFTISNPIHFPPIDEEVIMDIGIRAILVNRPDAIDAILHMKYEVNYDVLGRTAAEHGNLDVMKKMVDRGANIHFIAESTGSIPVADYLLEKGVSFSHILYHAIINKNKEIILHLYHQRPISTMDMLYLAIIEGSRTHGKKHAREILRDIPEEIYLSMSPIKIRALYNEGIIR